MKIYVRKWRFGRWIIVGRRKNTTTSKDRFIWHAGGLEREDIAKREGFKPLSYRNQADAVERAWYVVAKPNGWDYVGVLS